MSNPYSDKRWSDAPKPVNSECNSCKYHYGFGKCEKHPEGIPKEKLKQSFPGTGNYNKKYKHPAGCLFNCKKYGLKNRLKAF